MKIVISPAKSLDFQKPLPTHEYTIPVFVNDAEKINNLLKKKSPESLQKLMNISEKLANLNWNRNQAFLNSNNKNNNRAAIYTFNGDVYEGLDAHTLEDNKIDIMQKKLRILSGLYGILKPLDLIQPYRLEMGTKLSVGNSTDLYQFWKKKVTDKLVNELERNELLVNLASKEYFSVVDAKVIKSPIVSPEFKDFKNGKLKIISFYAKKARGMMARYLIEKNAKSLDDINSFEISGYRLSNEETTNKFNPVFIR
ncbi:peroxide stress protein YaaA [Bacteroidetes bacterium SCGC AAA795-G10]|nr:peroxide stress protein YaaA [Bacteroidetes bacterium SCGC AAA795-G10]